MPAARLTDRQKAEVVEKYRRGDGAQHLAVVFGCSPNTVIRAVKAALEPEEYERLKDRRGRRAVVADAAGDGRDHTQGSLLQEAEVASSGPQPELEPAGLPQPEPISAAPPAAAAPRDPDPEPGAAAAASAEASEDDGEADADAEGAAGPGVLAINDADDFGDDEEDGLGEEDVDEPGLFIPVPLLGGVDPGIEIEARPLEAAELPPSGYMLVDKTVELQPRPLSEFNELGHLPDGELERQALTVFTNPRQAKRLCGRTQRVIKIPDTAILSRTAPYLIAQGISRVVIEGALYALPGS